MKIRNILGGLEKVISSAKKHWKETITAIALPFVFNNNVNAGDYDVLKIQNYNPSLGGASASVQHIAGATNSYDSEDALYPDFDSNPLQIYSHIYNPEFNLKRDARDSNHITNFQDPNTFINIELYNKGFSGTIDNFLKFVIYGDEDFHWKNIFFKINQDIFDIKCLINNGEFDPRYNRNVGKIELEELDGSQTGVYNTGNVEFFHYCDFNRDRRIDGLDFDIFRENYGGNNETDPNTFGSYVGSDVNDFNAYADIDRSGSVDAGDLDIFKTYFRFSGDLNHDGKVGMDDFAYFANDWNIGDANFYDLGAFSENYLRDINVPGTW